MLLIKNARIATMDPDLPAARAVAVDGEYFARVGECDEVEAFARAHCRGGLQVLDLAGGFLMPGFHDSHMHFIHYVKTRLSVDLFGADSLAALLARMREALLRRPDDGGFLLGEGWNQERFTDCRRFPTRRDLDRVSADHPMLILRTCFHIGVLNTRAMELLGLDRGAAGRCGPLLELDEDGEPNGVVKEGLLDEIRAAIPSPSLDRVMELACEAQRDLFSEGLTGIQTDDFKYAPDGDPYALMEAYRARCHDGRLKLRIREQALLPRQADLDDFFARRAGELYSGSRFRIGCVKLLADGSLGGRTAFLEAPYSDAPQTRGIPTYDQEALDRLVLTAHLHNMPVAIHAIGDGAARMAIHAIARARHEAPWLRPRHGIVHCQVLSDELIGRMRDEHISAFTQPVFINGDMHIALPRLGPERLRASYAWNSLRGAGILQSFGTDCPVEHVRPMEGIHCAVTRRDFGGAGPFLPEQAMSVADALFAYTAGSARAVGEEHVRGMIRPGMLADFIQLDRDLLSCPAEDLYGAKVLRTWVGGECVYTA